MSLNLDDKKAVVAEVSAKLTQAQAIVLAEYRGLEVGHMTALRAKARSSNSLISISSSRAGSNSSARAAARARRPTLNQRREPVLAAPGQQGLPQAHWR